MTDYLDMVTKDTPKEERRKLDIGDIFINAVVCHECGDYLRSRNRHDFRTCSCENVGIDGGSWYQRVLMKNNNYTLITEYFNDM